MEVHSQLVRSNLPADHVQQALHAASVAHADGVAQRDLVAAQVQ